MERFSLFVFVLSFLMSIVVLLCFIKHVKNNSQTLSERALYTSTFAFSKSETEGKVVDVYVSDDNTKCFVLLQLGDTTTLPVDATKYQMFLTSADVAGNNSKLTSIPSGSFYVFGRSGYMGIYLVNTEGFPLQVLDLVIRSNADLTTGGGSSDVTGSFAKYDQARIYFNPGGSSATTLACLNKDVPSMSELYSETVIADAEKELHTSLQEQIDAMYVSLNQINEWEERVRTQGVVVPDAPSFIADDTVIMNDNGVYEYKPKSVLAGGFMLDWVNTSLVTDGFLDDLIATYEDTTLTYDEYLFAMSSERNADASEDKLSRMEIDWTLTDGTKVSSLETLGSSRYSSIMNDCNGLFTAWRTYYSQKKEYQVTTMTKLLTLELSKSTVRATSSVNASDDVLQCY